ncbi:MAG: hypothetical protein CMB64_04865 [Euryarchaeota archaeon]|nr:hypothetical protein [Euryarchaeota archaeon]
MLYLILIAIVLTVFKYSSTKKKKISHKFEITRFLAEIKSLQQQRSEYNGRFYKDGDNLKITYQKGQLMERCFWGCLANWHTHPSDYVNLFPDHPSIIDFHYIYNMTCKSKLVGSHLVFTPKYIYVVKYKCKNIFNNTTSKINAVERWMEHLDRSSYSFRDEYLKKIRDIGFDIKIYNWYERVYIEDVHVNTVFMTIFEYMIYLFLIVFILSVLFSKQRQKWTS